MAKSVEEKFSTVIEKNTFYFFNRRFEEKYEGYLNSIRETLLVLKNDIETKGLKKEIFEQLLAENENGLTAILALTGFSQEYLLRLITLIRVVDDSSLVKLSRKGKWCGSESRENIKEWEIDTITRMIHNNNDFRTGIVNMFFEGATVPLLANTIPLFELKKLGISKLQFDIPAMIDTLIRYKVKGSYSGKKDKNPEIIIDDLLDNLGLTYEKGDLDKFPHSTKRRMDFIIPNKQSPRIIVESVFSVTTSSGQGDKSKTELSIRKLINKYYPKAKFIGFVDGIGWYVRKEDLKRMVAAYYDVFTFHKDELDRFENMLRVEFGK
jgi:hypothetical protein